MLIKNCIVCDKRGEREASVRFEEGKIKKVAKNIEPKKNEKLLDAKGAYLLPGIIDVGASLGEGVADIFKALQKISKFAIKGGVTTLAVQPSTAINSEIGLDYFFSKSKEINGCSLTAIASATENNECKKLNNLAIIFKNGALGAFLPSSADSNILKRSMEYSKMYKRPLFVLCQNHSLDKGAVMHEGGVAFEMGLGGFSVVSESSEMAKVVELASYIGSTLIVRSISSQKSTLIAKEAKKLYHNIYFDLSLHHLMLTDKSCEGYNSYAKNYPPLREDRDREALIAALKNGTVDIVSSGHSPATRLMKDLSFEEAAFGIESLEFFSSALYALSLEGGVSLSKLSEVTSYNPAKLLGLESKGVIKEEYDADFYLFDPNAAPNPPHERSPYSVSMLRGAVTQSFISGECKFGSI